MAAHKEVSQIGYVQLRTSDLTGEILQEDQVVSVVVRAAGKIFDASAQELAGLKTVNNVVELELRHPDGRTEEILVSKASFDQVVSAEVLDKADSIRGRRTGFRPSNGS